MTGDSMPADELRAALQSARRLCRSGGGTVLDNLLRASAWPDGLLKEALRVHAGVAAWRGGCEPAEPDFSRLDLQEARRLSSVPIRLAGSREVVLAMADPWDADCVRQAGARFDALPTLMAATGALLQRCLGPAEAEMPEVAPPTGGPGADDGPVVAFVDAALRAAYQQGASDVHFECDRSGVSVKLRRDGVMSSFARLDHVQRAEEVISRIKVLAQLDITEQRIPQDGRFRLVLSEQQVVDLRVSIMPSVFGEDAVLRLLDKAQLRSRGQSISLDALGFAEDCARSIRELAELPHGMLLVTGPTGSGKTTTLYAVLAEVRTGLEKIITIEDPVEYELPGVLQIPVNERKGLTFAKGLRSILRHDPDRILVGEIRDEETAEIAVQSALTGHQVFTTVHANSVFDVTGRFRHFGLDMFAFASALNGIVVQRLMRTLCSDCAERRRITPRELEWLSTFGQQAEHVPAAIGCPICQGTGYRGRMVIAEVHGVDDRFRDLVVSGDSVSALREHVRSSGVETLLTRAVTQMLQGLTTMEEIRRVVGSR